MNKYVTYRTAEGYVRVMNKLVNEIKASEKDINDDIILDIENVSKDLAIISEQLKKENM